MIQACTPFHEAGHALVGEACGMPVVAAHVYLDGSGGHVDRDFPRPDAHPYAFPLLLCAGMAAEELFWGDPDTAWAHGWGDRVTLRKFGHADGEVLAWVREARAILREQEAGWRRLAAVLAAGGTIGGDRARAVLAGDTGPEDVRAMLAGLELRKLVPS